MCEMAPQQRSSAMSLSSSQSDHQTDNTVSRTSAGYNLVIYGSNLNFKPAAKSTPPKHDSQVSSEIIDELHMTNSLWDNTSSKHYSDNVFLGGQVRLKTIKNTRSGPAMDSYELMESDAHF